MIASTSISPLFMEVPLTDSGGAADGTYQIGKATEVVNNEITAYDIVYEGKLYSDSSAAGLSTTIDIQPIISNFYSLENVSRLPAFGGNLSVTQPAMGLNDYFKFITNDASTDISVSYNYTNYTAQELSWNVDSSSFCNDFFQDFVYNHTYISVRLQFASDSSSGSSSSPIFVYYYKNGTQIDSQQITPAGLPWRSFIISGTVNAPDDADYMEIRNVSTFVLFRSKVKQCIPENTFIIYYTNLRGGCNFIYCDSDKNSVVVNKNTASMEKYATINNRQAFGKFNYAANSYCSYTLQTNIMNDELSRKMPELFLTPYVWVYDYSHDRINSVIINDKSLTIKKYALNKIYNYTIKCEDSQTLHLN